MIYWQSDPLKIEPIKIKPIEVEPLSGLIEIKIEPININFNTLNINVNMSGTINVTHINPPTKPKVLSFTFKKVDDQMLVTVILSDTLSTDHISSRLVTIFINDVAIDPIEAVDIPAQFRCEENDNLKGKVKDINAAGETESDILEAVAVLPLLPPTKPSILGFVFSRDN